ncbi:hypothetical protein [Rickettsia parkeri]|uniref:hypothetical protein n=1 Tax=Rickettsia parkeri TaxID=35792 RepID=UPI000252FEF8|nr:hypothetical protein [Rickettsia parkeri]AFC74690.1 hypothetical protein MC1_02800 [Rickettsia parkeri str. Portsmouth]KJV94228.1 hypothetical protein RPAGB_1115 [Rickettsia parkeri str. Grand Bay]
MIIFLIFVVNALVNDKSALSIVLDNSLESKETSCSYCPSASAILFKKSLSISLNRYSILLLGVFSLSTFNFSSSELLKKYFKGVFKTFAKTYNLLIGILLKPSSYFLTWRALISQKLALILFG